MKETEFGSECSEMESEPRYPSEQLSGTERGRSLFQKDVKKVKRLRTNCSIAGGCGGWGGLSHHVAGGRRRGRSRAHGTGRAAHAAVPRPSRASGPFPTNFLFLKVKLVDLVGRVCRWDESAGGSPTLRPAGTSGSRAQLELGSTLSRKENDFSSFFLLNYYFKACSPACCQSPGKHRSLFFKQLL